MPEQNQFDATILYTCNTHTHTHTHQEFQLIRVF